MIPPSSSETGSAHIQQSLPTSLCALMMCLSLDDAVPCSQMDNRFTAHVTRCTCCPQEFKGTRRARRAVQPHHITQPQAPCTICDQLRSQHEKQHAPHRQTRMDRCPNPPGSGLEPGTFHPKCSITKPVQQQMLATAERPRGTPEPHAVPCSPRGTKANVT